MVEIGSIDAFDDTAEDFATHIRKLGRYMTTNSMATEKRVPVFIAVFGAKT